MKLTKLDGYEYLILPGVIRIAIESTTDPDLVDIMSEISRSDGKIYVEGCYYKYLNAYSIRAENKIQPYLELQVVQVA